MTAVAAQQAPTLDYEQLARVARFVIKARSASINDVISHLDVPQHTVERCLALLEHDWRIIGRASDMCDRRVLIHPAHVDTIVDTITTCQGVPPDHHPFANLTLPALWVGHHEIIWLVAHGLSNAQIATRMNISEQTVKTHLRVIFRVFGVQNRPALVYRAMRAGLFGDIPQKPGVLHG